MSTPSAAVVIPCHQAEQWLGDAIESALAMTGISEVVVVDDGSSDNSVAVARQYGSRVRLIEQAHRGGNVARNAGLAAVQAEWVQFLDADDYLEPTKITRQFLEAGPLAEVAVLYSPVWEETWRDDELKSRTLSTLDPRHDIFTQWISWQLPQTGGVLWRREALIRLGGWNEAMPCCQEHELYLRALQARLHWQYCPTPGAVYRLWSEQTVCRKDPIQVIRQRTRLIDDCLSWLGQNGVLTDSHRETAAQACFEMSRTWARYDMAQAAAYHATRTAAGLIRIAGPAAPTLYRLAYLLFGFRTAESLARTVRQTASRAPSFRPSP